MVALMPRASGPKKEDRCLDCLWCRSDVEFESGADYICIKFNKPLKTRKLWGPPCRHFASLAGARDPDRLP